MDSRAIASLHHGLKSRLKWIALFILALSISSFLQQLFMAKMPTVCLVQYNDSTVVFEDDISGRKNISNDNKVQGVIEPSQSFQPQSYSNRIYSRNHVNDEQVFHDSHIFLENYKEMKRSFKIYVYPHNRDDPFANALLPADYEPRGNYASEGYFKKVLMKSEFITEDPNMADLFYLPFSIASLRNDRRVDVHGIPNFIRDYISNISTKYPFWNRTGGADHFYVACHSIGKVAMNKVSEVKFNAIQFVCSSNYFVPGYISHKDACLPQIWPREGEPPNLLSSKRTRLAFFAGAINSPVRQKLLAVWRNDSEIFVNYGRLTTPYGDELLKSKFCLHVKGYEVNTARIGDSLYYGCVPVIIADYYDLPFTDILNWRSFSVVVTTADIPLLKQVLDGISSSEYLKLQSNVMKVRKHFQWHLSPVDYDVFYMAMYELWLRRSFVKVPFLVSNNS
ncbi:hypothetical protein UlMin_025583 [Ulmus minor]